MSKLLDKDKLWLKFTISVYSIDEVDVPDYLNDLEENIKTLFDDSVKFLIFPSNDKNMVVNNVEVLYDPKGNADENIEHIREAERLLTEFSENHCKK